MTKWINDNDYVFKASIIRKNGNEEPIKIKAIKTSSDYPDVRRIIFDKSINMINGDYMKIYQDGVILYEKGGDLPPLCHTPLPNLIG